MYAVQQSKSIKKFFFSSILFTPIELVIVVIYRTLILWSIFHANFFMNCEFNGVMNLNMWICTLKWLTKRNTTTMKWNIYFQCKRRFCLEIWLFILYKFKGWIENLIKYFQINNVYSMPFNPNNCKLCYLIFFFYYTQWTLWYKFNIAKFNVFIYRKYFDPKNSNFEFKYIIEENDNKIAVAIDFIFVQISWK